MKLSSIPLVLLLALSASAFCAPNEINIAYVKAPFNLQNMVMKKNQMLEHEFKKDGIQINWHNITSGAKQNQAMGSGSLDVSATMNTASLLMANSAGNPTRIATGVAHPTKVFAIVGKKGSEMKIEDLKGKTIVGPKGTVLHQTLVAALKQKGMTIKDVNFVSMDIPKSLTALLAGKVDAALLAGSAVIKANAAGAKTITTAEGLVRPNLVLAVGGKFAESNPDIVKRIVKVNREALAWINQNKQKALEIGAQEHGISLQEAQTLADWSQYYDTLDPKDIDQLEEDQDFLMQNGMMVKKVDVKKLLLPTATE